MREETFEKGLHQREINTGKEIFFYKDFSDFVILQNKHGPKIEIELAKELNDLLFIITGQFLDVVYDESIIFNENSKFIVLGDTLVTPEQIKSCNLAYLENNGYIIKTIGKSVFINGQTEEGTLFGIYDFLSIVFDYDFLARDEICFLKAKKVFLPEIDVKEKPDFCYREGTYGDIVRSDYLLHRFRFNSTRDMYGFGHNCHNSFVVLPPSKYFKKHPDWYTLNKEGYPAQLCYSNEEMCKEYIKNIEGYLKNKPNSIMLMGMEDNIYWCECENCKKIENKYGKKSVVAIQFANKVVKAINAPRIERNEKPYKFLIFAYYSTNDAPVKYDEKQRKYLPIDDSVVLDDNLGIMYAPGRAEFTHRFDSERNMHYFEELQKWQALTKTIHFWGYPLYAFNYLAPYPFVLSMQHNYKVLLNNNVHSLLDQTQHEQCNYSIFGHLHAYLQSKLEWNVNENQELLIDKFFTNYFKQSSKYMKQYFNNITNWCSYLYENTDAKGQWGFCLVDRKYFSKEQLFDWKKLFNQAYKSINRIKDKILKLRLYKRIRVEEISLDFLIIQIYGKEVDNLDELKNRFYFDFTNLGLQRVNEIEKIDLLWKAWGINVKS